MKVVDVMKWKTKLINEKGEMDGKEENTLMALTALVNSIPPGTMPNGLDGFRTMTRLARVFDSAEKSGKLVFEDMDYKFLRDLIDKNIPSNWGRNVNIAEAIEAFLNPRSEVN